MTRNSREDNERAEAEKTGIENEHCRHLQPKKEDGAFDAFIA